MIEIHKVNVLNVGVAEHQTGVGKEIWYLCVSSGQRG